MTKITPMTMDDKTSNDYLKVFSKRMLRTQLFVGTFQEKRYVEPLNSYRDVVKVHSGEKDFIENLTAVRKKLEQELMNDLHWIGITGPDTVGAPVGHSLWVILPVEVFGTYWFKVKTVEISENEVRVKLDVVRAITSERSISDISEAEDSQDFDLKTAIKDLSSSAKSNIFHLFKHFVTVKNITESVIFISLLLGTIIAGGVNIIKYLMEYLLKFIREFSGFIKVCTPIIISCVELVRKSIYGLFSLIVVLIYGRPSVPQPVYIPYGQTYGDTNYRPQYGRSYSRPALPYRSSVEIHPLDD